MLQTLAEQAAARAFENRGNLDDLVRLQRLSDLAVRRLRLDDHKPKPPGLFDYLRTKHDR